MFALSNKRYQYGRAMLYIKLEYNLKGLLTYNFNIYVFGMVKKTNYAIQCNVCNNQNEKIQKCVKTKKKSFLFYCLFIGKKY